MIFLAPDGFAGSALISSTDSSSLTAASRAPQMTLEPMRVRLRIVEGLREAKVESRKRAPGFRAAGMSVPAGHNLDELHQAWPEAEYAVVHDSGHSAMDPGIRAARVGATDGFESRV